MTAVEPNQSTRPPGNRQEALDRMEQMLTEQLSAAKREDYGRITALVEPIKDLLDWVVNSPQPAGQDESRQTRRIEDLRRRLKLTLAEQRRETGEKVRRLSRGHGSLAAYKRNTTRA